MDINKLEVDSNSYVQDVKEKTISQGLNPYDMYELQRLNNIIEQYLFDDIDRDELLSILKRESNKTALALIKNIEAYLKKSEKDSLEARTVAESASVQYAKLSHNFKHFQNLAELFPNAIAHVEFDTGKILHVNSKYIDLFAIEEYGFEEKIFYNLLVFEENVIDFKKNLECSKYITNFESEVARENNSFFLASLSATLFEVNSKKEFIVSIVNVEEEKALTEERERLLEELALSRAQIEEEAGRYVQVNLQLAESEEKLQELNATKDKFFSIIGHDLKNPLFVIQSMSEILETEFNEISDEEKLSFIKAVRESSNSAFALLEDLLHWARCQSGKIDFNPEPLALEKIVKDIFSLVEAQALKKHILLLSHINPSHMIEADKFMISTILRNLVSNAIKFTDTGGRVMIVTKEVVDMIEISVIDSGIGMSAEDINKLFRIDVKNSEIGKSKEKGTGLGLILCKEFAERHGGRIWVESELGKGSKFKFTVPKLT